MSSPIGGMNRPVSINTFMLRETDPSYDIEALEVALQLRDMQKSGLLRQKKHEDKLKKEIKQLLADLAGLSKELKEARTARELLTYDSIFSVLRLLDLVHWVDDDEYEVANDVKKGWSISALSSEAEAAGQVVMSRFSHSRITIDPAFS